MAVQHRSAHTVEKRRVAFAGRSLTRRTKAGPLRGTRASPIVTSVNKQATASNNIHVLGASQSKSRPPAIRKLVRASTMNKMFRNTDATLYAPGGYTFHSVHVDETDSTRSDPSNIYLPFDDKRMKMLPMWTLREIMYDLVGASAASRTLGKTSIIKSIIAVARVRKLRAISFTPSEGNFIEYQPSESFIESTLDHISDRPLFPPPPISRPTIERCVNHWVDRLADDRIMESGCAVCGALSITATMKPVTDLSEELRQLLTPDSSRNCTRKERSNYNDPITVLSGAVIDNECTHVCAPCMATLDTNTVPLFALANGFWLGSVPEQLQNLSWAEKIIISRVRTNNYIAKVRQSDRQKLIATCLAFQTNMQKTYDVLPLARQELEEVLAFVVTGSKPAIDDSSIRKRVPLFVRRNVVKRALEWLVVNSECYSDVEISNDNLRSYADHEDAEVPVDIIYYESPTDHIKDPNTTAVYDTALDEEVTDASMCEFTVSGLSAEDLTSAVNREALMTKAVAILKQGQGVLALGRSSQLENTFDNPSLYPKAFPWLFPYGLGGVKNTKGMKRSRRISARQWIRHLLLFHDKRFQNDEEFVLMTFAHERTRQTNTSACLKAKRKDFSELSKKITTLDQETLNVLAQKYTDGQKANMADDAERACVEVLRQLKCSSIHIFGSLSSRNKMRTHMYSMIAQIGAPTWFITISPSEHKSPICLYYADTQQRIHVPARLPDRIRQLVARNSVAAARYFQLVVSNFVQYALGAEFRDSDGLFGPLNAYYGTVEQQGRLTLHLHLLMWLKDAPTPDEIRKRLLDPTSPLRDDLIRFVESVVSTGPSSNGVDELFSCKAEEDKFHIELPKRCPESCPESCSRCDSCLNNERWHSSFDSYANAVVTKNNKHVCASYSCGKDAFNDCRARFPRPIVPETTVLEDGHLEFKKSHEWYNSYSKYLSYLVKANTDVQCLLSGTAVKAVVAYVTDYISKTQAKMSTMFDEMCTVTKRTQYDNDTNFASLPREERAKRILSRMTSKLNNHQEIGAPMAAAYMLGNPDHYTNVEFVPFLFTHYLKQVYQPSHDSDDINFISATDAEDRYDNEFIQLANNEGELIEYEPCHDYLYRPDCLENISLHEFIIGYHKIRKRSQKTQKEVIDDALQSAANEGDEDCSDHEPEDNRSDAEASAMRDMNNTLDGTPPHMNSEKILDDRVGTSRRSSKRRRRVTLAKRKSTTQENALLKFDRSMNLAVRGDSDAVDKSLTFRLAHPRHRSVKLTERTIPAGKKLMLHYIVPLPRRDSPDTEYYAATMLTLHKPWRSREDLRGNYPTWTDAFRDHQFTHAALTLIKNANVLYECQDARDDHRAQRQRLAEMISAHDHSLIEQQESERVYTDDDVHQSSLFMDLSQVRGSAHRQREAYNAFLNKLDTFAITSRLLHTDISHLTIPPSLMHLTQTHCRNLLKSHILVNNSNPSQRFPTSLPSLDDVSMAYYDQAFGVVTNPQRADYLLGVARSVSSDFFLNEEQHRAFHLVTRQCIHPQVDPLRLYIAGMGGTGKSQVIRAITTFFATIGQTHRISLCAPTGTAASLIGGCTIHSFLGLNDFEDGFEHTSLMTNRNDATANRLKNADFIFIDEVSMVGCKFLHQISQKLEAVKGTTGSFPFGGTNMIFAGDFAQLEPVMDQPLYRPTEHLMRAGRQVRQCYILGKAAWHSVTHVVVLRENMRQTSTTSNDERFRKMLVNMRTRACNSDDVQFLNSLMACAKGDFEGKKLPDFMYRTNSILLRSNSQKDAVNDKCASLFAAETEQPLHFFYSIDRPRSRRTKTPRASATPNLTFSKPEQHALWSLGPCRTEKVPGVLALCIGMPVMLKKNDATSVGMTNGAEATVVGWTEGVTIDGCKRTLQVLYVRLNAPPKSFNLQELPENVVPVVTRQHTIKCDFTNGDSREVIRTQVPIELNFALTDYASQGKTRNVNIVNLEGMRSQAVYTALSRSKNVATTAILSMPVLDTICGGLEGDPLLDEFDDIDTLDEITKLKVGGTLNPDVSGESRYELIRSFVRNHRPCPRKRRNCHTAPNTRSFEDEERQLKAALTIVNCEADTLKRRRAPSQTDHPSSAKKQKSIPESDVPCLRWNRNSCALDAALFALFSVWKDCPQAFRKQHALWNMFESVASGSIDFNEIRDSLRMKLSSDHPDLFPMYEFANACEVVAHLGPEASIVIENSGLCTSCGGRIEYHLCRRALLFQDYYHVLSDGQFSGQQRSMTNILTNLFTFLPPCNCTSSRVVPQHASVNSPDTIAIEIQPHNAIRVDESVIITIGPSRKERYRLAALLRFENQHFTAVAYRENGHTWYFDSLQIDPITHVGRRTVSKVAASDPADLMFDLGKFVGTALYVRSPCSSEMSFTRLDLKDNTYDAALSILYSLYTDDAINPPDPCTTARISSTSGPRNNQVGEAVAHESLPNLWAKFQLVGTHMYNMTNIKRDVRERLQLLSPTIFASRQSPTTTQILRRLLGFRMNGALVSSYCGTCDMDSHEGSNALSLHLDCTSLDLHAFFQAPESTLPATLSLYIDRLLLDLSEKGNTHVSCRGETLPKTALSEILLLRDPHLCGIRLSPLIVSSIGNASYRIAATVHVDGHLTVRLFRADASCWLLSGRREAFEGRSAEDVLNNVDCNTVSAAIYVKTHRP